VKYAVPARVGVQCNERKAEAVDMNAEGEDVDTNAVEGASPEGSKPTRTTSEKSGTLLMLKSPDVRISFYYPRYNPPTETTLAEHRLGGRAGSVGYWTARTAAFKAASVRPLYAFV